MGGHGEGIVYMVEGNGVSLRKVDAMLKNKIKLQKLVVLLMENRRMGRMVS